jgi:16S rRNA processing protein RimM
MQLVVGRIAKAHGVSGEVAVEIRTDDAEHRFARGTQLDTEPADRGPLVVEGSRWHSDRLLVRFAGLTDRSAAEALRNTLLVVDSATSAAPAGDNEYWDHDLIGLDAVTVNGDPIGRISDVLHPAGHAVLVITRPEVAEALVPFVSQIVPTVDLSARRVLIDPPDGLLDL